MIRLHLRNTLHPLLDLRLRILQNAVLRPFAAVTALQIVDEKEHPVIPAERQRIPVLAELFAEDAARLAKRGKALRHRQTGGRKGRLIPEEDTPCFAERQAEQLAVNGTHIQYIPVVLLQINDAAECVQVKESGCLRAVVGDPVLIDLHDIRLGTRIERGGSGLLPPVPCAVFGTDGDLRMIGSEAVNSGLRSLMAGLPAPPREPDPGAAAGLSASGTAQHDRGRDTQRPHSFLHHILHSCFLAQRAPAPHRSSHAYYNGFPSACQCTIVRCSFAIIRCGSGFFMHRAEFA